MLLFVLDTDVLTLYQKKHPRVTAAVRAHQTETAVTIISVEEQFTGWQALLRRARRPDELAGAYQGWTEAVASLATFSILSFTEPAMRRFGTLVRMKLNIGRMDLRIAAIALEHNVTVVTRNLRDFRRVPGLAVVDWSI